MRKDFVIDYFCKPAKICETKEKKNEESTNLWVKLRSCTVFEVWHYFRTLPKFSYTFQERKLLRENSAIHPLNYIREPARLYFPLFLLWDMFLFLSFLFSFQFA